MRTGESQLSQLGQRTPAPVWNCPELPAGKFNANNLQRDSETGDRVSDLAQWLDDKGR